MNTRPNVAVSVHAAGDLRVEEIPPPALAADEALVDIHYGGICGSDLHYWRSGAVGESILHAPMVLGHEVVGTVLQEAHDRTGPGRGTRVTVHPATLGAGPRYPADRPNLSGGSYLGSAARYPHQDGAFARQVAIPSRMLRELPAGITTQDAALIEPTSVAWRGVSRLGEVKGRSAVVVGCGPIGLLAIAVLRARGATEITAIDLHDYPLVLARDLGANRVLQAPTDGDLDSVDADVAVEATGHHSGLNSAIRAVTRAGKVSMVGLLPTGQQPILMSLAITRELELYGSFRFNDEINEVIAALNTGVLRVSPVISHIVPVGSALQAFEVAADPTVSSKVLLDFTA